jgi:hypothetical protein
MAWFLSKALHAVSDATTFQAFCESVKTLQELEPVVAESTGRSGLDACAEAVKAHLTQELYTHEEVGDKQCIRKCWIEGTRMPNACAEQQHTHKKVGDVHEKGACA